MSKYEVLKNGKKVSINVEKLEIVSGGTVVAIIDGKEYALAFSGSSSFAHKVGGTELLELSRTKLGEEEYFVIDYSYKLKKDIAILTKGDQFRDLYIDYVWENK